MIDNHFIDIAGKQTCYWQGGDPQGSTLLCLHGWLDNAASFEPLLHHFSDHQWYVMEFAGHGFSEHRSPDAHYHFMDWVYDVIQFIESKKLNNVCLLGHSLGGIVASVVAAIIPNKIDKLVMLEAAGAYTSSNNTVKQVQDAFISRLKRQQPSARIYPNKSSMIRARSMHSQITYSQAESLIERNIITLKQGYTWRSDQRLNTLSPVRLTEQQATEFITAIACPVIIILAEQGYDDIKQGYLKRQQYFKNLHYYMLTGGHHFHLEQAEAIGGIIIPFLHYPHDTE